MSGFVFQCRGETLEYSENGCPLERIPIRRIVLQEDDLEWVLHWLWFLLVLQERKR